MFNLLKKNISLCSMCKVLKIHADDYGYSENISQNILDCYKNGIININIFICLIFLAQFFFNQKLINL